MSLELEGKDHDETLTDRGSPLPGHALWRIACASGKVSLDLSSSFAGDKKDFSPPNLDPRTTLEICRISQYKISRVDWDIYGDGLTSPHNINSTT